MENKRAIEKYVQKNCFYLGERNTNRFIYKYMDLESAMLSLTRGTIRFVEPNTWQDEFEGRFYNASYSQVEGAVGNTPPVLACCLTHSPINEAAWKIYSSGKTGLGARSVQFKIKKKAFREVVAKSAKGFSLYEGLVNYELDNYQIEHLHQHFTQSGKENALFLEFFHNFDLASYLSLLLIKRQAFRHEQELRYFLVPGNDELDIKGNLGPREFAVNWKDILEDVKISEDCSDMELTILSNALKIQSIAIEPRREYIYAAEEGHITIDSNKFLQRITHTA